LFASNILVTSYLTMEQPFLNETNYENENKMSKTIMMMMMMIVFWHFIFSSIIGFIYELIPVGGHCLTLSFVIGTKNDQKVCFSNNLNDK